MISWNNLLNEKALRHIPENSSYTILASNVSLNKYKSSNSSLGCLVKLAKLAGYLLVSKNKTNLSYPRTSYELAKDNVVLAVDQTELTKDICRSRRDHIGKAY